jgi:hypothetical protein
VNEPVRKLIDRIEPGKEDGRMRIRTKLCFIAAALLFVMFGVGISERGQRFVIGTPATDHWQRDDQYMGAGLAPYVYCLAPAVVLVLIGSVFYLKDHKRGIGQTSTSK